VGLIFVGSTALGADALADAPGTPRHWPGLRGEAAAGQGAQPTPAAAFTSAAIGGLGTISETTATTGSGVWGTGTGATTTGGNASAALNQIDTALNLLASKRATAGALINRLEHTVSNLLNVNQRLQEAVSGIEDADYAAESAALAKAQVLAQAGTAMLAQANQSQQYVLNLLKGM
jgi:flagellin